MWNKWSLSSKNGWPRSRKSISITGAMVAADVEVGGTHVRAVRQVLLAGGRGNLGSTVIQGERVLGGGQKSWAFSNLSSL